MKKTIEFNYENNTILLLSDKVIGIEYDFCPFDNIYNINILTALKSYFIQMSEDDLQELIKEIKSE